MPKHSAVVAAIITLAVVTVFPSDSLADSGDKERSCFPMIVAEYCFPGGDLREIVPVDDILEQGQSRAIELKSSRTGKSRLSAKRRAELTEMWRDAIGGAFIYADTHSLTIDLLTDPTPINVQGLSPLSPFAEAVSDGALIRLGFNGTSDRAYAFDGKLLLHKDRVLRLITSLANEAPQQFVAPLMLLSTFILALPDEDGYVDVNTLLQMPQLRVFTDELRRVAARSDISFLGALGNEMIMVLYLAVEEAIRMRSIALPHAVHFYSDGSQSPREMDPPQVVWSGELLLSDEAVAAFSNEEMRLLMTHEALHLMRPNTFMVLSAADLTQRAYFPDLNTERTATFLNNFLGRPSPGRTANCPLDVARDDELFTDFYVFYYYRNEPEKQRAYHALLKRIHAEFNPGRNAPTVFRVQFADALIEFFETRFDSRNTDPEYQDALVWESIITAMSDNFAEYLTGKKISINDFLQEMEKHPDIAIDAKLIRIMVNYYKRDAMIQDEWTGERVGATLTCEQIATMLDMRLPPK